MSFAPLGQPFGKTAAAREIGRIWQSFGGHNQICQVTTMNCCDLAPRSISMTGVMETMICAHC